MSTLLDPALEIVGEGVDTDADMALPGDSDQPSAAGVGDQDGDTKTFGDGEEEKEEDETTEGVDTHNITDDTNAPPTNLVRLKSF